MSDSVSGRSARPGVPTPSAAGGEASQAPSNSPRRRDWWYEAYVLLICLATFAGKMLLASRVAASALFADDYIYLSHAVGRPEKLVTVGGRQLYSWLLAPVRWIDDPAQRFQMVLAVNALLAAVFVYFGTKALVRLTGRRSWLAPLCLAVPAYYLLFSLYALTENLLFPLLGWAVWLLAAGSRAFTGRRFGALLIAAALAPLTRIPGLALACGAVVALAMLPRAQVPGHRAARAALLVAAALVPYALTGFGGSGGSGEKTYLEVVSRIDGEYRHLLAPLRQLPAQVPYVLLASGIWMVPLAVRWSWRSLRRRGSDGLERERVCAAFVVAASTTFLLSALAHLFARQVGAGDPPFFFVGRYLDPMVLLLTFAGLAGVHLLPPLGRPLAAGTLLIVTAATWVSLLFLGGTVWRSIGHAGIVLLTGPRGLAGTLLALLGGLGGLWWWSRSDRARQASRVAFLLAWTAFNWATFGVGYSYVVSQSARVAKSQEVAGWLHQASPQNAVVCCDRSILRQPAPGAIKSMANVYRALTFSTFPRRVVLKDERESLEGCDFYFTTRRVGEASGYGDRGLAETWSNLDYVLYGVGRPSGATP